MKNLSKWFNQLWYQSPAPPLWLKGAAKCYALGQQLNCHLQLKKRPTKSLLPTIVIGNLTVGGTGKTPLVIALCHALQTQGIRAGVIMRGYQARCHPFPYLVQANDNAQWIGDEAALILKNTQAPIVLSPNRNQGIQQLAEQQLCDVVISDDGLQHYAMPRQMEIAVVDGSRGFGNHQLLPAGPLREPLSRLHHVDMIVVNGQLNPSLNQQLLSYKKPVFRMTLNPKHIYPLNHSQPLMAQSIAAFAGIGNPERFFNTLKHLDIVFKPYIFKDHHQYRAKDFEISESCIIMTEKDAVKCLDLTEKPIYVLPIEASLSKHFWENLFNHSLLNALSTL